MALSAPSRPLAVALGDPAGIGPEVVAVGLRVLDAVLPGVETRDYDLGAAAYHRTGEALPDSVLDELRGHTVSVKIMGSYPEAAS